MNPWNGPNASRDQAYRPPSSGKREESSLITSAPGTKKKTAASTHKLIDDVPLCPAAAIHRGPSTVAILNSSTSQKPIVLRSCDFESRGADAERLMRSPSWPVRIALGIIPERAVDPREMGQSRLPALRPAR